jgi:flagellar operon protein (TIGR03826 family)
MSLNVDNCPRCGAIYMKNYRNLCNNCVKAIDQELMSCTKYLRDNRRCTMEELSEATGVSTKQIMAFIREGRISVAEAPNLTYPCDLCGSPIRKSNLCDSCRTRIAKDIRNAQTVGDNSRLTKESAFLIGDRLNKKEK